MTPLLSLLLSLLLSFPVLAQAFPSTPILDNANRADENPLSDGGNWTYPILQFMDSMKVVSNAIRSNTTASGSAYRTATYGPGVEAYITITTMWANNFSDFWLWMHGSGENTASVDGYSMYVNSSAGVYRWQLFRKDNGVETKLGADISTQTVSSGDAIGLEDLVGGTLQVYYKPSGGSWGTIGTTRSDNTYTSGHIGFSKGYQDATSVLDDFGGGTIPSGSRLLTLTGVGQ